eukprot:TRINITY_DN12625_c0_g1_i1.p1 TRINITY_DN12625_c0_g1~~TRINITY_DN12625_c0_g1_i1.p1  ORF type:complete len:528 (+),score=165.00 TRINITY_DN12625_c0_g1_i1:857-2440(+)
MVSRPSAGYVAHHRLPSGWTVLEKGEGKTYFKTKEGKFLKNRRKVLAEMLRVGGFSETEVGFIRDGLEREGWRSDTDLPKDWLFKQYNHKIEGVDSDVLYLLSPWGSIFRSKKSLRKYFEDVGLTEDDFHLLYNFKPDDFDQNKKLTNPDENWVYDPECVPVGWKFKKYSFNSKVVDKVEEVNVYHYLTPDSTIIRGKKQIYDYMIVSGSYNAEDYQKFHFNKRTHPEVGRPRLIKWSDWETDDGLPEGWEVREGVYKYQKKVQYKSPDNRIFLSRLKVLSFLNSKCGEVDSPALEAVTSRRLKTETIGKMTRWGGWRTDYIPSLPGWMFSIGHRNHRRVIRYMSPSGEVFRSRGPLLRFLKNNRMRTEDQLLTLKKLLKTNQAKHFDQLRRNDKFIKNFEADLNYLLFLKIRYKNHDVEEVAEDRLPDGWKRKLINGVEYFRDPTGEHVFNSRRLVVEHLRGNRLELEEDRLREIMGDSGVDSDLSESDFEESDIEEELDTLVEPIVPDTEDQVVDDNDQSDELFS